MFAVVVSLQVNAGDVSDFMALMQENAAASLSEEPDCHRFDICSDDARVGEVLLYELYTDAAAFDAHLETAHFKSFDVATASMVVSKEVRTYTQVRP